MSRASYHHGDLRQAILDAALERIMTSGIEALSLRAIARDVGVTHAAPYRHFADKAALLGALAAAGFERLGAEMVPTLTTAAPSERLRAMGLGYVRFAAHNPAYFKVMFGPGRGEKQLDMLVEAIRSANAQGHQSADRVALAAWCMVHGIATLVVDGRLSPTDVGLPEADIDGLVEALLSARPQPGSGPSSPPSRRSDTG